MLHSKIVAGSGSEPRTPGLECQRVNHYKRSVKIQFLNVHRRSKELFDVVVGKSRSTPLIKQILTCWCVCLSVIIACECVVFDSGTRPDGGVFMSPNFPDVIPGKIDCLLYSFVAKPDQLVQLRFLDFSIYPPNEDQ